MAQEVGKLAKFYDSNFALTDLPATVECKYTTNFQLSAEKDRDQNLKTIL